MRFWRSSLDSRLRLAIVPSAVFGCNHGASPAEAVWYRAVSNGADSRAVLPRQYRVIGIVVALSTMACAVRGPAPALIAEAGIADASLREGCYRCLEQALATF